MGKLNLHIGIPSGEIWHTKFGMDLSFLLLHLSNSPIPGFDSVELQIHNAKGSILAASRQRIVNKALKDGATHLLFLDSDQTFPATLVHRLLKANKLIVGCNVATKMLPPTPTARLKDGTFAGAPLYTRKDSRGLERVWRLGTGIMMINMNVFKRPDMKDPPHFPQVWVEELQDYAGEDWGFNKRLEDSGVSIWVDQDLSKEIGHVGNLTYGHDMIEAARGVA